MEKGERVKEDIDYIVFQHSSDADQDSLKWGNYTCLVGIFVSIVVMPVALPEGFLRRYLGKIHYI